MEKNSVKNENITKLVIKNNMNLRKLRRECSLSSDKFTSRHRELSIDSEQHVKLQISSDIGKGHKSLNPCGSTKIGTISKQLEEKLKEITNKITAKAIIVKNIQKLKREKITTDTERLYISFLTLFSELDHTINTKGLKINPIEVMMNYIANPNNIIKAIQKLETHLRHCKISESNF